MVKRLNMVKHLPSPDAKSLLGVLWDLSDSPERYAVPLASASNGWKRVKDDAKLQKYGYNMDRFNDNFNDRSSFDVKNAEAPFNCSFKMKIQSKRKKFEHDCTASGSGRNYKCDLVPGF